MMDSKIREQIEWLNAWIEQLDDEKTEAQRQIRFLTEQVANLERLLEHRECDELHSRGETCDE